MGICHATGQAQRELEIVIESAELNRIGISNGIGIEVAEVAEVQSGNARLRMHSRGFKRSFPGKIRRFSARLTLVSSLKFTLKYINDKI